MLQGQGIGAKWLEQEMQIKNDDISSICEEERELCCSLRRKTFQN